MSEHPGDECENPAANMAVNPDPSNTPDVDCLTVDLDPDDDAADRLAAIHATLPAADRGER